MAASMLGGKGCSTWLKVENLGFWVSGFGFRVSGFWFRVSSSRFRFSVNQQPVDDLEDGQAEARGGGDELRRHREDQLDARLREDCPARPEGERR